MTGVVRLQFGPEQCCGVAVSRTHVLTSRHQLLGATSGFVDADGPVAGSPCRVIATHPEADLAIVAVAVPRPSWAPQPCGGGTQPPFGGRIDVTGFSAGRWSAEATCLMAPTGHATSVVDCQRLASQSVPCIGDSGSPAWSNGVVVGICSGPVRHTPGCNGAQMLYTFIDDERARWIARALTTPYNGVPDDASAASGHAVRDVP